MSISARRTAIDLHLLAADDADRVAARADLHVAVQRHDQPYDPGPSRRFRLSQPAYPMPGGDNEFWIAFLDDVLVGCAEISLPILDNTTNAGVEVLVHPDHRRAGIGRHLAQHALNRARANGRNTVVAAVRQDGPGIGPDDQPGVALAKAIGAKCALVETRRRLDLTTVARSDLERLDATARATSADYHLVGWAGTVPDELVDGVASLETRMVTDAPMGELAWEAEQFDAGRWRQMEAAIRGRGQRTYGCASVHTASGEVTGYTMCAVTEDVPEQAWQWATIVLPSHRGHRLGMRLKADNLIRLQEAEPAIRAIDTWNAQENAHMIAVNDLFGFVELDVWAEWQIELT